MSMQRSGAWIFPEPATALLGAMAAQRNVSVVVNQMAEPLLQFFYKSSHTRAFVLCFYSMCESAVSPFTRLTESAERALWDMGSFYVITKNSIRHDLKFLSPTS